MHWFSWAALCNSKLNGGLNKWDIDRVCTLFVEAEADRILSISFSKFAHEDVLVWKGDPTGVYTVVDIDYCSHLQIWTIPMGSFLAALLRSCGDKSKWPNLRASKQLHHYVPNAFVAEVKVFIQTVSFADDLGLREYNMVSHLLAAVGFNLGMDHFWVKEILVEVEAAALANI
ncbi:hypothetical protein PVK06_010830 [Gossypium arboreum]|uniref:Uncharacterized protein n=1 Tax=Gossypium arboreum TaxID=29729 RepID=A0ABR0Q7U8_GOSAR|nr:hypothetical protein PVK06_010830 [Gossypium arboreum]